jgi:thioredoxin-related protein
MNKFLLTLVFVFFTLPVWALELLMFNNKHCGYCSAFIEEVAVDYKYKDHKNKDLPLVIIDAFKQPDWFREAYKENRIKGIFGTPTFIIWNGRKELGRIIGYNGKQWFYERLNELFQK